MRKMEKKKNTAHDSTCPYLLGIIIIIIKGNGHSVFQNTPPLVEEKFHLIRCPPDMLEIFYWCFPMYWSPKQ
jgi:hypothetical protein